MFALVLQFLSIILIRFLSIIPKKKIFAQFILLIEIKATSKNKNVKLAFCVVSTLNSYTYVHL